MDELLHSRVEQLRRIEERLSDIGRGLAHGRLERMSFLFADVGVKLTIAEARPQ